MNYLFKRTILLFLSVISITAFAQLEGESLYEGIKIIQDKSGSRFVQNELLIRFNANAVKTEVIDDKEIIKGKLSNFIAANAIAAMNKETNMEWGDFTTYKIFLRMTTADSVSVTRLGDTIKIEDFWTTLRIKIKPAEQESEADVARKLKNIPELIRYAHRNFVGELDNIPNDQLYTTKQSGLYDPDHGIDAELAWNRQVGQNYIKVGVFDTGINWRHEDFGDGTVSGTKVTGGWDYKENESPFSQTYPDNHGHGSIVSGIIGALRNNGAGIAGVVGGDVDGNGNTGCQLYSMKLSLIGVSDISIVHSIAAEAIVEGAVSNPNTGYGFGLEVQNHSWGTEENSLTLQNAVETCFKNHCAFVVSSGNDYDDRVKYPATYNDNWVMKVGANDVSGSWVDYSTYSNDLDFIAPGNPDLYYSLSNIINILYTDGGSGTSFAAPHVAGTTALLMSEHNLLNPNYSYPNDLAPEDVEIILQKTATDKGTIGYDIKNGYGRINANSALEQVSLPNYYVKHSGGQGAFNQTVTQDAFVTVPEGVNGLVPGDYLADRHEVIYSFTEVIPNDYEVIDVWGRFSSSEGYNGDQNIDINNTSFDVSYNLNANLAFITTTTYTWKIKSNLTGTQTYNQWLPAPPALLETDYSIHLKNTTITNVSNLSQNESIHIYPNPSKGIFIIESLNQDINDYEIRVFDITGQEIIHYPLEKQNALQQTIDLSNHSSGIYFFEIMIDGEVITKKIIKQ